MAVLALVAADIDLPSCSGRVDAAQDRITPQELAVFAVIAGAVFVAVTYFLAKVDRRQERAVVDIEEERRSLYVEIHPNINVDVREAILRGELLVDMTGDEVTASWGPPRRKEVLESTGNVREQWIYYRKHTNYSFTTYFLIFVNGRLTEW